MRLLLVEDEMRMAQALREILHQEKYDVDHFANGLDGSCALETGAYDLAILDVMLPGKTGFEIAQSARRKGIRTPILILSAKGELDDKVTGLDCGADNYLTKPFMTKELLARLRALSRQTLNSPDGTLSTRYLRVGGEPSTLRCGESSVRLSEKELRILEYLIANQGQILTREQLAVKIWGLRKRRRVQQRRGLHVLRPQEAELHPVQDGDQGGAGRRLRAEVRPCLRDPAEIVASILATLVLLLFGTICVIYLASYADMTNKNQWLLKQYVETYSLSGKGEPDAPAREPASGTRVPPPGWSSPPSIPWPCPRTASC